MDKVVRKSYGKINLGLDVVRRRDDGYHEVDMIMQTVGLFDRLEFEKIKENRVELQTNLRFLPTDENNLIYKAVCLMKERYQISTGMKVTLEKHIPVAAGMAGGSSNCAIALKAMNELFDLKLSKDELCEIGVKLGADVPYCIMGGTARAQGIGEVLTQLPPMPSCFILVAKPGISVSTKFVYENLDLDQLEKHPDIDGMVQAIEDGSYTGICNRLANVLETVTIPHYPIIQEVKEFLEKHGATKALMSGSGPTIFGLFEEEKTAKAALKALRLIQEIKQAYVVKPV